jgi:hypothetical protein
VTALKIAGIVVLAAAVIYLSRGQALRSFRGGNAQPRDPAKYGPQRTGPTRQPSTDCCFVWIEDGLTGKLIAGQRPIQNSIADAR